MSIINIYFHRHYSVYVKLPNQLSINKQLSLFLLQLSLPDNSHTGKNLNALMKKSLFILSLAISSLFSFSQSQMEVIKQDNWKIKWNKKVILNATTENETKNIKKLKKAELSKKYSLEINYKESDPAKEKAWNRSFLFFGDNDNELLRKESVRNVTLLSLIHI